MDCNEIGLHLCHHTAKSVCPLIGHEDVAGDLRNAKAAKNLLSATQVDPFVQLSVRDGRKLGTKTVWNNKNPEYNEVLNFIVDDPKTQSLTVFLKEHDFPFHKVHPSFLGLSKKSFWSRHIHVTMRALAHSKQSLLADVCCIGVSAQLVLSG